MLKKENVYMLKDKKLGVEVIWLYYDVPIARHSRKWKTTKLVTRNYWWLGVTRNVG